MHRLEYTQTVRVSEFLVACTFKNRGLPLPVVVYSKPVVMLSPVRLVRHVKGVTKRTSYDVAHDTPAEPSHAGDHPPQGPATTPTG